MKKIVSLTAILLMVILFSMTFTACAGISIKNYLPLKERENPGLNNSSEIVLEKNEEICPIGGSSQFGISNLAALREEKMLIIRNTESNTYYLYDLAKETYAGGKIYTEIEYFCGGIFLAAKGTEDNKKYGLLSANGEELRTNEPEYIEDSFIYQKDEFEKSADGKIIRVSFLYYKIVNRTIAFICDTKNVSFGIDPDDIKNLHLYGDFLYAFTGDAKAGVSNLTAYGVNGIMLKNFENEGENTKYFILNGGKILIKKDLIMPGDTRDYTYVDDDTGDKRLVKYEIFDLDAQKFILVNFNYYVERVECYDTLSDSEKEYFSSEFLSANKITAYEIKEKRLVKTNFYKKGLIIDNSLNIKADIGLYDIHKLSDDRFLWVSQAEKQNSYVSDKNGETIFLIGANYEIRSPYNDELDVSGDIIVVYNKVIDKYSAIDKDGIVITKYLYDKLSLFYGGKALGEKDGMVHIISSGGTVEEQNNIDETSLNFGVFYKSTSNYVYSPNGTKLFSYESGAYPVKLYDGTYFFIVTLSDNSAVYQYVK